MITLFLVFAVVGAILLAMSLVINIILVMGKYYAYKIISEQDEIIREYEEMILRLEEGNTDAK